MAYLGEKEFDIKDTPFADYTPADWSLYYIESYGQFDGRHHKAWVLDQIARVIHGTPLIIKQATWDDHEPEWRVETGEPSEAYLEWVGEMRGEWDDDEQDFEYWYEEGVAP